MEPAREDTVNDEALGSVEIQSAVLATELNVNVVPVDAIMSDAQSEASETTASETTITTLSGEQQPTKQTVWNGSTRDEPASLNVAPEVAQLRDATTDTPIALEYGENHAADATTIKASDAATIANEKSNDIADSAPQPMMASEATLSAAATAPVEPSEALAPAVAHMVETNLVSDSAEVEADPFPAVATPHAQGRRRPRLPMRSPKSPPTKRPATTRRSRMQQEIHLDSTAESMTMAAVHVKNGHHCIIHTPTLAELQRTTFSNYVRTVVLPAAAGVAHSTDRSVGTSASTIVPMAEADTTLSTAAPPAATPKASPPSTPLWCLPTETAMELREGIAKIRLPRGFFVHPPYGTDTTGRGPQWQAGTALGDKVLQSPIAQHILGMTGVYEYTHSVLPSTTLAEFRDRADKYRTIQMGSAVDVKTADSVAVDSETTNVTNVNMDSSLDNAPMDRVGNEAVAVDSLVGSNNVNVSPVENDELSPQQVALLERQFWRQLSPTMPPPVYGADEVGTLFGDDPATGWSLANLDSCLQVLPDIPGVTSPYLYAGMWASVFCAHSEDMNLLSVNYLHAGSPKLWYTVAEPDAARFVSLAEHHYVHHMKHCKEFLRHKRCLLSPEILKAAGIRYQTAVQYPGDAIVTFPGSFHFGFNAGFNIAEATNFGIPEWLPFGRRAKICLCRPDSVRIDMNVLTQTLTRYYKDAKRNRRLTWKEWRKRQERKEGTPSQNSVHETEDEIIQVISYTPKKRSRKTKLSEQQAKNEYWIEVMLPSALTKAAAKKGSKKVAENPWHLAKPVGRKRLDVHTKVLCLVPAPTAVDVGHHADSSDEDVAVEETEHCLAGTVLQVSDGHVLIHFNGMNKSENKWLPVSSPKLFLDGGRWQDEHEQEGVPALHYWKEMDSKLLPA